MTKKSEPTEAQGLPALVATEVFSSVPREKGMFQAVKQSFRDGADFAKSAATVAGEGMTSAAQGMKKAGDASARVVGDLGSGAYHAIGDLNGDGKVDEEDWKIARASAGRLASGVAREAGELGKAVARHEITKDAAAGAAVGALIAIPVPIIGPIGGAAAGAVVGLTRGVIGSGAIGDVVGQVVSAVRSPPARKPARRKK